MSLGLALQQLMVSAQAPAPARRERPVKVGYCHRCKTDGKQLRFARWGAKGGAIFNNYCTDCHKAMCKDIRERIKK